MTATIDPRLSHPFLSGKPKQHLIGGSWTPASSNSVFETVNPSTGAVLAEVAHGTATDVDRAVSAAREAFETTWSRFKPSERQDVMLAFADVIAEHYEELRLLDILEMGMPIGPDLAVGRSNAVHVLRYFAGWATKIHGETASPSNPGSFFAYTLSEPIGVVASIMPWNSPAMTTVWKLAPALATGCTVILKPAEESSLSCLRIGELVAKAGIPDGVVNIVTGAGEVGAALAAHPGVDKISFTGSTDTGRKIVHAATGNLKRVSLELGGKSPNVIFADADLEAAIPSASWGVFRNSGQICYAGTRIFVERPVYEQFLSGIAEFAQRLTVGNSIDPNTQIGPIVSAQQLERVTGYLSVGRDQGARVVAGGERLDGGDLANGYFVAPTVFGDVSDDMSIAREEIFGPVASVLPFDDVDEVIQRANATEYGLGAGVWTRDVGKAHRMARSIRSGQVWVNTYGQVDPSMPFGGYKTSGWGREMSEHSLTEYLNVKSVWINDD